MNRRVESLACDPASITLAVDPKAVREQVGISGSLKRFPKASPASRSRRARLKVPWSG